MTNYLYEKTGIKLTKAQAQLFRDAIGAIVGIIVVSICYVAAVYILAGLKVSFIHPDCLSTLLHSSENAKACVNAADVPGYLQGILFAVYWLPAIPLITHGISYITSLASDASFREKEMTESVDFLEEDEREQMITMKATRRAYMVLNFTLLVAWIFSLFSGDMGTAVTLFVIQLIGALSFRRQIQK